LVFHSDLVGITLVGVALILWSMVDLGTFMALQADNRILEKNIIDIIKFFRGNSPFKSKVT
jgi:hypothetical protein